MIKKKKKVLFVIESLACAGAEKSLISLLNLIDYESYEVDLQLFSRGGELECYIPKEVHVLPLPPFFESCKKTIFKQLISLDLINLFSRIAYSIDIRIKKYTHPHKAKRLWQHAHSEIRPIDKSKKYDIAIAYAHGVPTYYVATKIKSKQKFAWVNGIFKMDGKLKNWQRPFYQSFCKIACVSETSMQTMVSTYPEFKDKFTIIWDIINPKFIEQLANEYNVYPTVISPLILTVARYTYQKGYDITIETARILKNRGVKFIWIALGKGDYEKEMREKINHYGLSDVFILEGTTPNPYPYFKRATIYVQTSRNEGFGLSIAEARLLNTPVITSEFDAVYMQMKQGKNGVVTSQNPTEIADAIISLLEDTLKYDSIVEYLKKEKKGNLEELQKFYNLIDS